MKVHEFVDHHLDLVLRAAIRVHERQRRHGQRRRERPVERAGLSGHADGEQRQRGAIRQANGSHGRQHYVHRKVGHENRAGIDGRGWRPAHDGLARARLHRTPWQRQHSAAPQQRAPHRGVLARVRGQLAPGNGGRDRMRRRVLIPQAHRRLLCVRELAPRRTGGRRVGRAVQITRARLAPVRAD